MDTQQHVRLRPRVMGHEVPTPVVQAGRAAFRRYGAATSMLRQKPDFLVIGAKRCGTTSFYFHLLQHEQVLPLFPSARLLPKARDGKGPHYFDSNYDRGDRWYLGHFPTRIHRSRQERRLGRPVVVGEASPYYLYHPLAPARAAQLLPDVRLIVLLRDPVERTFSHFREQSRNGVETLSFRDALAAEQLRTAGEEERILADPRYRSFAHEQQSYVAQSRYLTGLQRWLTYFPRERMLVIPSEDYYRDSAAAVARAWQFLGLTGEPGVARRLNAAPPSRMDDDLRIDLVQHFEPHTAALEQTLGMRFDWQRARVE